MHLIAEIERDGDAFVYKNREERRCICAQI